jgi:hypothetical protein
MRVKKGDKIKSSLSGTVFEVLTVEKGSVLLFDVMDHSHQMLTSNISLQLFYEKVNEEGSPLDRALEPAKVWNPRSHWKSKGLWGLAVFLLGFLTGK